MFRSLQEAVTFYDKSENKWVAISELTKRFQHHVIQEEPCLRRVSSNLTLSWTLHLTVQAEPDPFVFVEVGSREGSLLAQMQYFSELYGKRANLIGISESSNPFSYDHFQEPYTILQVRMSQTMLLECSHPYTGPVDIMLWNSKLGKLNEHLLALKEGGILIISSKCDVPKNLTLLFEIKDSRIYCKGNK